MGPVDQAGALAAQRAVDAAMAEVGDRPNTLQRLALVHLALTAYEEARAAPVAQQSEALDADEMTRLRRLIHALGMDGSTNASDEQVRGLLFTALGQAAGKIERAVIQSEAGAPTAAALPKCSVCNDTRCVPGALYDPPNECEACFDQEPTSGRKSAAPEAGQP